MTFPHTLFSLLHNLRYRLLLKRWALPVSESRERDPKINSKCIQNNNKTTPSLDLYLIVGSQENLSSHQAAQDPTVNGTASTRPGRCGERAKSHKNLEVEPLLFNPPRSFPPEFLDLSSLVSTYFVFLIYFFYYSLDVCRICNVLYYFWYQCFCNLVVVFLSW